MIRRLPYGKIIPVGSGRQPKEKHLSNRPRLPGTFLPLCVQGFCHFTSDLFATLRPSQFVGLAKSLGKNGAFRRKLLRPSNIFYSTSLRLLTWFSLSILTHRSFSTHRQIY